MLGKVENSGKDTKSRSEPISIVVGPKNRGFLARGTRGFFTLDGQSTVQPPDLASSLGAMVQCMLGQLVGKSRPDTCR